MTFVVRMESEHVASLTATRELLVRIKEAFGCDCQELIDDIDDVLFRAERERKLPEPFRGTADVTADPTVDAPALLRMAREWGLMPDDEPGLHSVHSESDKWWKEDA